MFTPTDEQTQAADHFHAGDHMALQAGAGTGKTSTLALLASGTKRRGRYLAYNRAIAQEAAARFPSTVICKTAHSLAYAALGHRYARRLGAPRRPAWQTGQDLGITKPARVAEHTLMPATLSNAVLRTVTRFCHSADAVLTRRHVPPLRGLDNPEHHRELADLVLPYAEKAWADLQHPDDGAVRFDPDHFLKIWSLTNPKIHADFLFLDEAQDTNPVVEHIFNSQRDHAQLVMVGDSAQAIYHWRGAKDVMTGFDGTHLTLSRSFRFGPVLATEANRWLTIAEAPLRLTGSNSTPTDLGPLTAPDAILCRTNVGAMKHVMTLLSASARVALVGGGESLRSLALAARQLQGGRSTSHPELVLFPTWGAVQDYAAYDPSGRDLQPLVDLVDTHGTNAILNAVSHLTQESHAHVTISTAHKAKGREWARVKIGDDFPPPRDTDEQDAHGKPIPGPIDPGEARLAYVAVTRARHHLDIGGLAWLDDHPAGSP
ncbi:UvrD-helicase domain-containing protein [Streptomyces sp. SKN60]|uniref:UvrD-helicase domain-containing protein n=1 Tax=Streptomyces sp. SKN60 TaxID=2855506 RepID=UPI0022482FBF|nr:UvrD-helicase domain-containing protein [Streptomyces sp. SKN60]MCX2184987.1 UvrD-helicase domain-containing protein [Streptomyces sp. SKN60]